MEETPLESVFERWERIEGVIFDMTPPPSSQHQAVVGNLYGEIYFYLKINKHGKAFLARLGVWLDDESGNYVEPDIVAVCDRSKIHEKGCIGAPDLIIEVLSPTTARKDKLNKFNIYEKAGVKEYWIVEPDAKLVSVFTLQENNRYGRPDIYSETDNIEVSIFPDLVIELITVFEV